MKVTKEYLHKIISEELKKINKVELEEGWRDVLRGARAAGKNLAGHFSRDLAPDEDPASVGKSALKKAFKTSQDEYVRSKEQSGREDAEKKAASSEHAFDKYVNTQTKKMDDAVNRLAKAADELYKTGFGGHEADLMGIKSGPEILSMWQGIKSGEIKRHIPREEERFSKKRFKSMGGQGPDYMVKEENDK